MDWVQSHWNLQIEVHELAKEWILDSGTIENYGVILIDDKEEIRSSIPQYAHDDTEPYHYTPEMTICEKPIHTCKLIISIAS